MQKKKYLKKSVLTHDENMGILAEVPQLYTEHLHNVYC